MFISLGEILIIIVIALIVLQPQDLVLIMSKAGNVAKHLKEKYENISEKVRKFFEK
jgi:Sec-independent protein translocase protein TatA